MKQVWFLKLKTVLRCFLSCRREETVTDKDNKQPWPRCSVPRASIPQAPDKNGQRNPPNHGTQGLFSEQSTHVDLSIHVHLSAPMPHTKRCSSQVTGAISHRTQLRQLLDYSGVWMKQKPRSAQDSSHQSSSAGNVRTARVEVQREEKEVGVSSA